LEIKKMPVSKLKLPVGRMISGDIDTPRVQRDSNNVPRVDKAGQEIKKFNFGIAIPKRGEQHWNQTEWGRQIWDEGVAAYGNLTQRHDFSWKIDDGDSQMPNTKGKRMCDRTGAPGHWVLWFAPDQAFRPKVIDKDTRADITAHGYIVPGFFVQLYIDVAANGSMQKPAQTPGVYLNPIVMAKMGDGEKILADIDVSDMNFDSNVSMPGMQPITSPEYSFGQQPPQQPPQQPNYGQQPPQQPNYAPPQEPDPRFLQVPPAPVMTPKAGAIPYETFIQNGWTDAQLREHGYIV